MILAGDPRADPPGHPAISGQSLTSKGADAPSSSPGYSPRRQLRVDRRRILLSSSLAALAGTVLMLLVHRAAHTPGQPIKPIPVLGAVLLVAGAASCGAWGETMRQLALTQLGEPDGPEEI